MAKKNDPRIAVVCGGPSAEAGVSRVSGREVAKALSATYANVAVIELNPNVGDALKEAGAAVVFPALHGPPGEDGTFQGFLETLGLPYVGSGVHASACGMDKVLAKHLFRDTGLPVAPDVVLRKADERATGLARVADTLGLDVVVKPARQGSALGVKFATSKAELAAAVDEAFAFDDLVLVEKRITGLEITVGILDRNGVESFPVIEVRTPRGSWYDFEHRYTVGLSEHIVPAPLSPRTTARVQEVARAAHVALGCRDLSRVDFVALPDGEPVLLEVNTLPGMTPTSLYPDGARAHGLSFEALVALFIDRAVARGH